MNITTFFKLYKNKILGALIIVVIILGIVAFFHVGKKPIQTEINKVETPDKPIMAAPSDHEITANDKLYDLSIHYPVFGIPVVDEDILTAMNKAKEEFLKAFIPEDPTLISAFPNGSKGFLNITYTIKKSLNLSTIIFNGSEYTGGAHPIPFIITYHIHDNKLINLDDVFTVPASSYLPVLQKYATATFSKEYGEGFFKDGVEPRPENWTNWYIDGNKLVILFGAYQVAAYVNGEPDLSIPFSEIKTIAKPDFFN